MTITTMRAIDRFVGIPLCWVSGMWLAMMTRKQAEPHHVHTALVIKFFGLGSILLSAAFLSELRRHQVKIILLTFGMNRDLAERLPQPVQILTIRTDSPVRFILDTLSTLRFLREAKPDVVFDLEFFSKFSTLLSSISGATVRIGFALPTIWRRLNVSHTVPFIHSMHAHDLFLEQLRPIGLYPHNAFDDIVLASTSVEAQAMERKIALGEDHSTIITMNINAGPTSLERRWPPDRFVDVAERIRRKLPNARFFLIGSEPERGYVQSTINAAPASVQDRLVNCAGLLSMGELIALFERSHLFLTNDSGPMHIASAVGTPMLALFGPESPRFYGPVGNAKVIYKSISCSPCMNVYDAKLFVCPYNARCMQEISVEEVVVEIDHLMQRAEPRGTLAI